MTDPSIPELIDAALADPQFGAWVAAHPFRTGWVIWHADLRPSLYNAYLARDRYLDKENAPDGAASCSWDMAPGVNSPSLDPKAAIHLDPWTGAVIDRWFFDRCLDPADCAR